VPEEAKTVNAANNDGLPVVLRAPRARVSRALQLLLKKIESSLVPALEPLPEPNARRQRSQPYPAMNLDPLPALPMGATLEMDPQAAPTASGSTMRRWMGGWLPRRTDAA
jgi:hypothetical protein